MQYGLPRDMWRTGEELNALNPMDIINFVFKFCFNAPLLFYIYV